MYIDWITRASNAVAMPHPSPIVVTQGQMHLWSSQGTKPSSEWYGQQSFILEGGSWVNQYYHTCSQNLCSPCIRRASRHGCNIFRRSMMWNGWRCRPFGREIEFSHVQKCLKTTHKKCTLPAVLVNVNALYPMAAVILHRQNSIEIRKDLVYTSKVSKNPIDSFCLGGSGSTTFSVLSRYHFSCKRMLSFKMTIKYDASSWQHKELREPLGLLTVDSSKIKNNKKQEVNR